MKQIEATGKKIDDAIKEGLKILGVSLAEVDVEVLEQGGIFRKAKVRLTVTEDDETALSHERKAEDKHEQKAEGKSDKFDRREQKAEDKHERNDNRERKAEEKSEKQNREQPKQNRDFVQKEKQQPVDTRPAPVKPVAATQDREVRKVSDEQVAIAKSYLGKLLELMKIDAQIEIDTSHGNIDINLVTEDTAVIGHRGEVLDALQILTKRAVEEGDDKFVYVNVDSHNYRVKREQALVALAQRMANKCIKTGRKVTLEPMNNTHRKIIHATLSDNDKVITRSEGKEPNRKVVIIPKRG